MDNLKFDRFKMKKDKKKLVFTVINDLSSDRRMHRICTSLSFHFHVTLVGRKLPNSIELEDFAFNQKRLYCFFRKGFCFYIEYNVRLFFYLLFSSFDVYGAVDLDTILPNKIVANLLRKPWVYDAHEYFTEVIEVQNRHLVKKIWKRIERFCLDANTKAYTVSESIAAIFKTEYGSDFKLIRNCPPIKELPTEQKFDAFTFVYVGAVNKGRGLEECIKAIDGLDAQLLICGDGDVLTELIHNLPLHQQKQVTFTGFLSPNALEAKIAKSHVGLLLLQAESLSYYYSLANKFFDYVQAEIPQITIDFPEYKKLNDQFEVALLSSIEVEQIRSKMTQIIQNKEMYTSLVGNTKLAKHHWCWQNEEQKLFDFYKHLL